MDSSIQNYIQSIDTALFDKLPLGISILDGKLNLAYQNNAVYSWLPELMPKKLSILHQVSEHVKPSSFNLKSELQNMKDMVLQQDEPYETVLTFSIRHRWIQLKFTFSPIYSKDQQTIGILESVENCSEQYELAQAMMQSKRFENVGRLASGIAHDFNNILQVIIGHCEIQAVKAGDNENLIRSLDVILTSGQKASALTRQLLIFSRKQESEFSVFHLHKTLTSLEKILSRMVGEDIQINLNCEGNKWCINADESQIEQIFLNLTVNGRDAMPLGGIINITTTDCMLTETDVMQLSLTKAGKYVKIHFSDSGLGIDADNLEHIFDPFFTTKKAGKGSGLGLATVYSIVRQHQGIVTVNSEINVGTVFEIFLPAAEKQNASLRILAEQQALSAMHNESILIVEDDAMVLDLASQVLAMHGYVVETATCVQEAIEMANHGAHDLYLIDIVLPDGSGVDLVEYLREIHPDSLFLLSSGYTEDKPQIKRAIDNGYDFLHKPYTINTLQKTCREILDKKKRVSE
jgi:signal transduction histidine kinase/CheY-like chemotaxis protein